VTELRAVGQPGLGSQHPGIFRSCEFTVGAGINEKTGRLWRDIPRATPASPIRYLQGLAAEIDASPALHSGSRRQEKQVKQ
jgi:hypothetical protein